MKIVVKERPLFIVIIDLIAMLLCIWIKFKFWYIPFSIILIITVFYLFKNNKTVLTVYSDRLKLEENGSEILFNDILYWDYNSDLLGTFTIVFRGLNNERLVFKTSSVTALQLNLIFAHKLKNKNYKLQQYNAPFITVKEKLLKGK